MTDLAEARRHVEAAAGLLHAIDGLPHRGEKSEITQQFAGQPADAFTQQTRMGVQIDAARMTELVELAAHLRLTPALTLKLALRALSAELAKGSRKGPGRLVGRQRGEIEGRR